MKNMTAVIYLRLLRMRKVSLLLTWQSLKHPELHTPHFIRMLQDLCAVESWIALIRYRIYIT